MAAKVYVATETIHIQDGDNVVTVYKGQRIREGHAYLKGREAFFREPTNDVMYDVEAASAAPGEKRGAKQ